MLLGVQDMLLAGKHGLPLSRLYPLFMTPKPSCTFLHFLYTPEFLYSLLLSH